MTIGSDFTMDRPHTRRLSCATRLFQASALTLVALFSHTGLSADEHDHGEERHDHGHEEESAVRLDPESMEAFGVVIRTAGPRTMRLSLTLSGSLVPHEDRFAHVTPRYPGVIREVRKRLGDPVAAGEVVAVVESNESLQTYEVKAPLTGMVVKRHAIAGEFADEGEAIFEVANYSKLYADFYVFPPDTGKARVGQSVVIHVPGKPEPIEATISFLSPVTDSATQSRFVRAVLDNPDGILQPGMFVTGDLVLEEVPVPLAVGASALRTSEGKPVVFVEEDGRLEPRPVAVGRKGGEFIEITKGLSPGDRYAEGNTFILQAELEKGEAEHEH